jgi:hypothetical protein
MQDTYITECYNIIKHREEGGNFADEMANHEVENIEHITQKQFHHSINKPRAYITLHRNDTRYITCRTDLFHGNFVLVSIFDAYLCFRCRHTKRKRTVECFLCQRLYNAIVQQGISSILEKRKKHNQDYICVHTEDSIGVILFDFQ